MLLGTILANANGAQLFLNFLKGYLYAFIVSESNDPGTLAKRFKNDSGKFKPLNKKLLISGTCERL